MNSTNGFSAKSNKSPSDNKNTPKSLGVTWIFGFLFGALGLDRFYLRQFWTGALKLLTGGGLGIWTISDLAYTASGKRKDKSGRLLETNSKELRLVRIGSGALLIMALFVLSMTPQMFRDIKRSIDINRLSDSIKLYETDVSALLPNTVSSKETNQFMICGSSCQEGFVTTSMLFYKPKNISISEYQTGLSVPNADAVYIVTNSTCDSEGIGLGNSKIRDIAILYRLELPYMGTVQQCTSVPAQKYNDINKAPYCGAIPSNDLSSAANQFLKAKIELNKAQMIITDQMEKAGNQATASIIDEQLVADKTFLAALDKIEFDQKTAQNVAKLKATTTIYDAIILQERQLIRDGANISIAFLEDLTSASNNRTVALLEVYKSLKLPEPVCRFMGP